MLKTFAAVWDSYLLGAHPRSGMSAGLQPPKPWKAKLKKKNSFCRQGHIKRFTWFTLSTARIEVAELKLLRPLAGYTLYDHKTNDYIQRTPRTTDYRRTRQDRWIQTELASTLAKNATKPNPFEIILLQTTRKENNWKSGETLEREVVTLETERIKGSSPWCLWWWSSQP